MLETARAPITTILFTELVDSTTLMQRVGGAPSTASLLPLDAALRPGEAPRTHLGTASRGVSHAPCLMAASR
jgi:hypothetical protein